MAGEMRHKSNVIDICLDHGQVEVSLEHDPGAALKLKGPTMRVRASQSGRVMRGEFVQLVQEYEGKGDRLRFGVEDVHILAAEPLREGRTGVVFAQGGTTKFKVLAQEGGELTLGNTVEVADEAMGAAALVSMTAGACAVLYSPDGWAPYSEENDNCGYLTWITLDGRGATVGGTFPWGKPLGTGSYDTPYNIAACRLSDRELMVSSLRRASGGEAWVQVLELTSLGGQDGAYTGVNTLGETKLDVANDTDAFAGAWSIAMADETTAVVSGFSAYDQPLAISIIDVSADSTRALTVRCAGEGKYASSLPTTGVAALGKGRVALAYGVAWLSESGAVLKSTVALEVWSLTRYAAELQWYGCEEARYQAGMGSVSILPSQTGLALGYVAEGTAQSAAVMMAPEGPRPGPPTPQGGVDGFFRVVPITKNYALAVTQAGGSGYVRLLELGSRAAAAADRADGVALTGGEAGEELTIAAAL